VNQVYSTAATHGVPPPRAVANPGSAFPDRYTVELHARKLIEKEGGELTDPPPWMARRPRQEKIPTIPVMKPGMTALLVTGDAHRNKVQTMRGGNSATIEIQPTSNWDELMAALGYLPRKSGAVRVASLPIGFEERCRAVCAVGRSRGGARFQSAPANSSIEPLGMAALWSDCSFPVGLINSISFRKPAGTRLKRRSRV
jgi:hypothetical protein